jgi:dTDP-4-amino-4,6-dideoxygalactose transaminase
MDVILPIAARHGLLVIDDAGQRIMATHGGRALGAIGHLGTLSVQETKPVGWAKPARWVRR